MLRRNFITAAIAMIPFLGVTVKSLKKTKYSPEIEKAYGYLHWGTYGKSGKDPLKWVRLIDCETDHLQNILKTELWHMPRHYEDAIHILLKHRGVA